MYDLFFLQCLVTPMNYLLLLSFFLIGGRKIKTLQLKSASGSISEPKPGKITLESNVLVSSLVQHQSTGVLHSCKIIIISVTVPLTCFSVLLAQDNNCKFVTSLFLFNKLCLCWSERMKYRL